MSRIDNGEPAAHVVRRIHAYDEATPLQAQMAATLVSKARSASIHLYSASRSNRH
jgi:hypothetical protein